MTRKEKLARWVFVLIIVLAGGVAGMQLRVNDDALDLLPDGAVRGDLQLLQEMGLVDRIFLTLKADESTFPDPDEARAALHASTERLGQMLGQSETFSQVTARLPDGLGKDFFTKIWPIFPLLIDTSDLQQIEQGLDEDTLRRQLEDAYLRLNGFEGLAVKEQIRNDPLGYLPLLFRKLTHLQPEFHVVPDRGFLMSEDGRSALVLARSTLALTDSEYSRTVFNELESAFEQALKPGVRVEMIGTLPHTLANSRMIAGDLKVLLPAASLLLILLLTFTLRDKRAFIVFGIPFLGALPAIAITSTVFGEISGLALGFGIVILGIAVDFSVHLFLALTRETGSRRDIMGRLRRPFTFACLTTASVLVVLFFSDVASHRQMATLALCGILFGVLFAWLLIPAVISPGGVTPQYPARLQEEQGGARRVERLVVGCWFVLLLLGVWSWPHLHYNGDLRVLDAPDERVIEMERNFSKDWGSTGERAFVVSSGETLDRALSGAQDLLAYLQEGGYSPIQSPAPLLPDKDTQSVRARAWYALWDAERPGFDESFLDIAAGMGFSSRAFQPFFQLLDGGEKAVLPAMYEGTPFGPLLNSMIAHVPGRDGGPGRYLVLTTVGVTKGNLAQLLDYSRGQADVSVLANSKWRAEVELLLKKDIVLLSGLAGLLVCCLVTIQFRNISAVAGVLAPVGAALAAMALFCRLTGSELNMMHLIMGIMVIGLSVDYGIFIVCACREGTSASARYAVSICAASSLIGFGVLAFASHPALHSLGTTVLVGIGAAWPTALAITPAMAARKLDRGEPLR